MVDERVVEAVLHGGSELFQILLVQRQGGDDLPVSYTHLDVYKRQAQLPVDAALNAQDLTLLMVLL